MSEESKLTTNHNVIRRWAEERDGAPATVADTARGNEPGVLRIAFRDADDGDLEPISWEAFFAKFDRENMAFLYQEETDAGKPSRFFKFVNRE